MRHFCGSVYIQKVSQPISTRILAHEKSTYHNLATIGGPRDRIIVFAGQSIGSQRPEASS